jgi:two-component system, NarL family, response regulator NreC
MRIIVVDDHRSFRDTLRIALAQQADIAVVADASSGREALQLMEAHHADVVVVDVTLPDTDGASLTRELRRLGHKMPVLILTMHHAPVFARDAFAAGAQGYAMKSQPLTELIGAIRTVAAGERYVSPALGHVPTPAHGRPAESGFDSLSRREREVFALVIQGRASAEIGKLLSISLKTVETHRAHINRKLGTHSSAELMRIAAASGLLGGSRGSSPSASP